MKDKGWHDADRQEVFSLILHSSFILLHSPGWILGVALGCLSGAYQHALLAL